MNYSDDDDSMTDEQEDSVLEIALRLALAFFIITFFL